MKLQPHPRIQIGLLAVLFVLVGGYQIRSSADLYDYLTGSDSNPRYPVGISSRDLRVWGVRENAPNASGLQRGDLLLSIDGRAVRGLADLNEPLRWKHAGDSVVVSVLREGQRIEATLKLETAANAPGGRRVGSAVRTLQSKSGPRPPADKQASQPNQASRRRAPQLGAGETTLLILTGILTVWFCFVLGFFVAFRRPADVLAWEVLGLLLGFGQMAEGEAVLMHSWGLTWSLLAAAYVSFASTAWPAFLLWFGLDFPDPASRKRFLNWLRWPLTVAVLAIAVPKSIGAAGATLDVVAFAPLNQFADTASAWFFWATAAAISVFFANLGYKRAKMADPDGRRRLRMLNAGALVSLVPIFALLIATRIWGGGNFIQWPPWTWIPPLLMLSLFPVTLAYVIVVERAMDVGFVIRQGLQYALATRAIFVVQVLLTGSVIFWATLAVSEEDLRTPIRMQLFSLAIIGVLLLRKAAELARVWIDRKFFRERVEAERVLSDLGQQVRRIMDTPTLLETVASRISSALHVPRVELALSPMATTAEGVELELPLEAGGRNLGWLRLGPKKSEEPFSGSDRKLLESVAVQTALALENHRLAGEVARESAQREFMQRELDIAREVQERLLPHRKPEARGLDYAGRCRPAQSVGGDYYEYFMLGRDGLCCAVGDVSGKGIPAALVMASLQSSLRGLVFGGIQHLADLFEKLNELLDDATTKNRFATLFFCRLDPASGLFTYTSAGHNPALLVRADGTTEWLDVRGIALGLVRSAAYPVGAGRLMPGDVMVIYSDGITETFDTNGAEYGEQRMLQLAVSQRDQPAGKILDALFADAERFASGAPQHDDMTAIVIKRDPNGAD
ncbi:MAG TPA: SpoIIE family protein phosphatase [Bryobacteraceae bacterium]|nr:SpoIIE family protein phosphatase [Bryobacteraceae bacterium]